MKIFLVVTCLLAAASAIRADIMDPYLVISKDQVLECAKESGYTDPVSARAIYDKYVEHGAVQSNCVGACVFKSLGIMANSKFNTTNMIELDKRAFPDQPAMQAKLKKVTSDCIEKARSVTNECIRVYTYLKCFVGNQ